jgi:hypothetical protein
LTCTVPAESDPAGLLVCIVEDDSERVNDFETAGVEV